MKHKVLDLFAGIGGFSLGLEATGGFETTAFCELDKKAQLVLKKHWPDTPIYEDIKELTYERLQADGTVPTVITGGFPCQDISCAGKGTGIKAERSGLWSEMFRLIRDVRPAWAIIENVSTLRSKGLTLVLQNLSSIGYMCEWHCIPASAVGAPHQRDRIWIVAHPISECPKPCIRETLSRWKDPEASDTEPSSRGARRDTLFSKFSNEERPDNPMANPSCCERNVNEPYKGYGEFEAQEIFGDRGCVSRGWEWWQVEPNVGRVAHGIPNRVDRLKQLGNSVVPQIPYLLALAILSTEASDVEEETDAHCCNRH